MFDLAAAAAALPLRRMGTHPSCPSALADNGLAGTCLKQLLQQRPELLGAALQEFGDDLPFLFKVLSVGTALSIQSHPDKKLAEQLHKDKPEVRGRAVCEVALNRSFVGRV